MTLQQTSLLAYAEVRDNLGPRQAAVLDCIAVFGPMNNRQIAQRLHWDINSVTPRVLELRKKQLVERDRTDVSAEGRKVMFWRSAA